MMMENIQSNCSCLVAVEDQNVSGKDEQQVGEDAMLKSRGAGLDNQTKR